MNKLRKIHEKASNLRKTNIKVRLFFMRCSVLRQRMNAIEENGETKERKHEEKSCEERERESEREEQENRPCNKN